MKNSRQQLICFIRFRQIDIWNTPDTGLECVRAVLAVKLKVTWNVQCRMFAIGHEDSMDVEDARVTWCFLHLFPVDNFHESYCTSQSALFRTLAFSHLDNGHVYFTILRGIPLRIWKRSLNLRDTITAELFRLSHTLSSINILPSAVCCSDISRNVDGDVMWCMAPFGRRSVDVDAHTCRRLTSGEWIHPLSTIDTHIYTHIHIHIHLDSTGTHWERQHSSMLCMRFALFIGLNAACE